MLASTPALRPSARWRSLGRLAHGSGTSRLGSVAYAADLVPHELDDVERALVVAGWDDAAAEVES